jgi:predicted ATPase
MHIQRIQVPDFRALKNVDISFEKEFTPRIFPLGSQNGGGKSTLLQLIFVLLHCSGNPDRVEFIQNLLSGFQVNHESGKRTLAIIDIWDGSKTITLEFFVSNESYIVNLLKEDGEDDEIKLIRHHKLIRYYNFHEERFLSEKISPLEDEIDKLDKLLQPVLKDKLNNQDNVLGISSQSEGELIFKQIGKIHSKINDEMKVCKEYKQFLIDLLENKHLFYICNFNPCNNSTIEKLICKIDGIDIKEANVFCNKLSNKIFLTAHVSQIFLFLKPANRKSLFKTQKNNQFNYYQQIKTANSKLPGFFTYDFLSIDILLKSFKKARDDDFQEAVKQRGNYGNNYVKLLDELNNLLSNKKINVEPDLSGVNFKIDGDETELYPEDLSHGELKRLCIYMWLKHNKIEDAIVLMDELEISFHPDWQYQIVRDLEEWGATNQYILATHSYELCNAVTPAHVKELDPKLQARTIQ